MLLVIWSSRGGTCEVTESRRSVSGWKSITPGWRYHHLCSRWRCRANVLMPTKMKFSSLWMVEHQRWSWAKAIPIHWILNGNITVTGGNQINGTIWFDLMVLHYGDIYNGFWWKQTELSISMPECCGAAVADPGMVSTTNKRQIFLTFFVAFLW